MIELQTINEYDNHVEAVLEEAKNKYPEYQRFEITSQGTLYCWSFGAYPTIIKNFTEAFTIE